MLYTRIQLSLRVKVKLEGFESGVQAAYGNFLPTLGANASWQWNKTDQQGFFVDQVLVRSLKVRSQRKDGHTI